MNRAAQKFTPFEIKLLIVLAIIQFTHIVDFMIVMPLGPMLMRFFEISPQQFGTLVSSYTFSASIFGLVGALVMDRFDRKKVLLTLYTGFISGTLACGLAPSFSILMVARIFTGAFGGGIGAIILSMIGDQVPEQRRGAGTGVIMSAFSLASILGVPFGLSLATWSSWHLPFLFLGSLSLGAWLLAAALLPEMKHHMQRKRKLSPAKNFVSILRKKNLRWSLSLIWFLMLSGFSIIPFLSPYLVLNVGMKESQLPLIYMCGGAFTFFSARWIGALSDRYGKPNTFRIMAGLAVFPLLLMTHLPRVPLPFILVTTTIFMVVVSGRTVPGMALITSSVHPWQRGSFMSLNSSVQMVGAATASLLGGLILQNSPTGELLHFNWVGWLAVLFNLIALMVVGKIKIIKTKQSTQKLLETVSEPISA